MVNKQEGNLPEAVRLLVRWKSGGSHLDDLLEQAQLGHTRWLVMEAFRQWLVVKGLLEPRLRRQPRPVVEALLRLATTELLLRDEPAHPQVVHNAVEVAGELGLSRPEAGFVNAVLRGILREPGSLTLPDVRETHPGWLVERWIRQFGPEQTRQLLAWNQSRPVLYLHAESGPEYAEATEWAGFFRIRPGAFERAEADLRAGRVYVQDPFTIRPVDLLEPQPGERILDLCAAPGGKTRLIASRMKGKGQLLAVDRPGPRQQRLEENLARLHPGVAQVLASRIEDIAPGQLPGGLADAALIDVPCSNTGVIQRRPDVKLRLQEGDIPRIADYQLLLLEKAAALVRPGGRLVYSTCSLEAEENRDLVKRFCGGRPDWMLSGEAVSLPWLCGRDGGGAFLLTKGPCR